MKKYLLPVLLACVCGFALSIFLPLRLCLTVTDARGKCVWARPVSIGDRYTIRFIHSVMRTPVDEIYEIDKDCSVLRETVYDMVGAGLPSAPEEGQTFSIEDDKFHIRGYSLRIPDLTYRINMVVADHELLFDGR